MSQWSWDSEYTPEEQVFLIHAAIFAVGGIVGSAAGLWLGGARWLLSHHVILPSTDQPVVALPFSEGAGLDGARLLVLAGALLCALALLCSSAYAAAQTRREM